MEFKSIEKLTITDCSNHLSIPKECLKQSIIATNNNFLLLYERIFGGQLLTGINKGIRQRLILLLSEDRRLSYNAKPYSSMKSIY